MLSCSSRKRWLQRRVKKNLFADLLATDIVQEIETLLNRQAVEDLDLEALELAVRQQALQLAGAAVEQRLNADTSDERGSRTRCASPGYRKHLTVSCTHTHDRHGGCHGQLPGRRRAVDGTGRRGRGCQAGGKNRRSVGKRNRRRLTLAQRPSGFSSSAADPVSRHGWNWDSSTCGGTRGPHRQTTGRIGEDRGGKALHHLERGIAR